MLYDPKWEKQKAKAKPKADPYSLASLIAWLEKQPPENVYPFNAYNHCALAQWHGGSVKHDAPCGYTYCLPNGEVRNFIDFKDVVANKPRTFGAALERARKLSAKNF